MEAAHELIGLDPDEGKVVCGFVIGHRGDPSALLDPLRERERPSDRKPASELAFKSTRLQPPD